MAKLYIMAGVRALHEIFTVIWLGSMFTLAVGTLPALWGHAGKQQIGLADAVQRRLRKSSLIAMVGLAITGLMLGQSSPISGALFRFDTPYATVLGVKHVLTILMVGIAIARQTITRPQRVSAVTKRWSVALLWTNLVLGVGVLYLSSLNTAIRLMAAG